MTEVRRILDQYDRVMNGDAWHGDPIWQILDGISAEKAALRPHRQRAQHLGNRRAYGVLGGRGCQAAWRFTRRAQGGRQLSPVPPEATEANWQTTLDAFRASNQALREALQKLDPARLDERSAAGKRSFYDEAHGLIEHNVYHAGQIALLAKAMNQS
jgi:hypothetical protein